MKTVKFFILCLFPIMTLFAQTDIGGTFENDSTLTFAGSPYTVISSITIPDTCTLTIEAGVIVKFNDGRYLTIYGNLVATEATFTTSRTTPAAGAWNGILFGSSTYAASATLTDCNYQYAQNMNINNGSVTLAGTDLLYISSNGIEMSRNATLNMSNGQITGNSSGAGIYLHDGASSTQAVLNNVDISNWDYGILMYGASRLTATNITISNCDNHGVYMNSDDAILSISGSTISSITNYGVCVNYKGIVNLDEVTITSCSWPIYYGAPGTITTSGSVDLTGNTRDAVYIYHTSNSNHWVLPSVDIPYYFRDNYTVSADGVLEIGSGNILKFNYHDALNIEGTLIANADVGEYIYFTSEKDDNWGGDTNNDGTATAPATGNWYGIKFKDTSVDTASVMRRCKVRYAGYGSTGGISMYNASPTIDSCDISYNYYGLYLQYDSNPILTNNTIGSSQRTPIAMSFEANPTMANNTLSFADNEYDAIGLLGGTLTADAVLSIRSMTYVPNMTYLMLSYITVPVDMTLTINKGIVIKAVSSYSITVNGTLIADATADSMITFTSVKDDNYGNPGDTNRDGSQTSPSVGNMGGINFASGSSANSILNYCRFNYARSSYGYAVVSVKDANPTILNCEMNNSSRAIACYQGAEPVITNNTITNTQAGYTPFAIEVSANPTFSGNSFINTGLVALGLFGGTLEQNGAIHKKNVAGYENITYVLLSNLTIGDNTYLAIDPGVVIKMENSVSIYVNGGFKAEGTTSKKIIFTSYKDDNVGNPMDTNGDGTATSPGPGNWGTVQFNENSDDSYSKLDYCELRYGGYYYSSDANIQFINASPTIINTIIEKANYYGLKFEGTSSPIVDNVTIQNCNYDPIAMSIKSNPQFSNITFNGNGSQGLRLLEGTLSSDATLSKRDLAGISNIAYIIGSLTVSPGVVLTVDPGVVIKLTGSILVHGGLSAVGTVSEKVVFTSLKDDASGGDTNNDGNASTPTAGNWGNISYYDDAIDSVNILKHCEINYSKGISITSAHVSVDSCVIQQVKGNAFSFYGTANPTIQNCGIYNVTYYYSYAFGIYNSSSPTIQNNEIINVYNAPITMNIFASPTFSNNTIQNVGRIAIDIESETLSQSDTISQRSFAGYENITYVLKEKLTINSGTTITIPAGTVFKNYGFYVNGNIQVNGTAEEPVILTRLSDDMYGNPEDTEQNGDTGSGSYTYGFYFTNSSDDASQINHCIIKHKSYGLDLNSASPTVNNTLFEYQTYGLELNGVSAPVIKDCHFKDLTKTPIRASILSYPSVTENNTISGTTHRGIEIINETLSQDFTLTKRNFAGINNIPYLFNNFTVGTGAVLTISPGVICKFYSGGSITVNKGLLALGGATSDSNIVFTSYKDDFYGGDTNADSSYSTPSYWYNWYGITFGNYSLAPYSKLKHCIFRYGGYNSYHGVVKTNSASPTIEYCSFTNNSNGIITSVTSNPVISYCDFNDNYYYAVKNDNGTYTINAQNNWWGDNSGPEHADNPLGTGDKVSDGVDFTPWLSDNSHNPITGDVSLNGSVQAYDAALILQYSVSSLSLNEVQLLVADVSGNGSVTAFDASYILQYAVGLIQGFPAEELYKISGNRQLLSDISLSLPDLTVDPGETITAPVSLNGTGAMSAMQIVIKYDPELLTATEIITTKKLAAMQVLTHIDESSGEIRLAAAGTEPLASDGIIANITLAVRKNVSGELNSPLIITRFLANETDLTESAQSSEIKILGVPTKYTLKPAYPNPFNPSTTLVYELPENAEKCRLSVYNMLGQETCVLFDGSKSAGRYSVVWHGLNKYGAPVKSGIYFVRLVAKDFVKVQKITLVK